VPSRHPVRRRVIAISVAAGSLICLVAAAEIVARNVVDNAVSTAAPEGMTISPTGSAVWGLITGSMPVSVEIGESALTELLGERVESVRIDDAILLSTTRETPTGASIPIELVLMPTVTDGSISVEVVGATINGMNLPAAGLEGFGPIALGDPTAGSCVQLTPTSASVEGDLLVIGASVPVSLSGRDESC